ncbi:MAG: acyl-ACP--UDP-N-acetylglucosamine O-acyltransferase [Opitutales bacterium]|nr:acyl-ACP--UDP-N-acetylglucosamine O-acyltransferase [Opitutales bacterium]
MKPGIHPSACVEAGAQLGEGVEVGAFAYIGPHVIIGDGCRIHHHATVEGRTTLGKRCEVFPYAFIGGRTQDKKWTGDEAPIRIGDDNIFREFCTVHPSTFATASTTIGDGNLFCSYAHIGHESTVGSHCVFSNNATLGGHVYVGDYVVIGGLTAVHQFCRVGESAMLGGCGKVIQDVLPYMMADGHPAVHRTINKVGLQRRGFSPPQIQLAMRLFKRVFRSGENHSQSLAALKEGALGQDPMIDAVVEAMAKSQRGFA